VTLDELDVVENFHLQFLIQLSRHLGFGVHEAGEVLAGTNFSPEDDEGLRALLVAGYEAPPPLSYACRKQLLDQLLMFYYRHVDGMKEVRSVDVLAEVLR
jgi:DNA repair protein RecO (recombination protein O)